MVHAPTVLVGQSFPCLHDLAHAWTCYKSSPLRQYPQEARQAHFLARARPASTPSAPLAPRSTWTAKGRIRGAPTGREAAISSVAFLTPYSREGQAREGEVVCNVLVHHRVHLASQQHRRAVQLVRDDRQGWQQNAPPCEAHGSAGGKRHADIVGAGGLNVGAGSGCDRKVNCCGEWRGRVPGVVSRAREAHQEGQGVSLSGRRLFKTLHAVTAGNGSPAIFPRAKPTLF